MPKLSNISITEKFFEHTCGKELTTWGLRFNPDGRPLLKGRLFPAGRAWNAEEVLAVLVDDDVKMLRG